MAFVRSLAFTPDGKSIVSAGDDKVVRIWDWRAGKAVRAFRGQTGPGAEGKIFAMALSPNGRWLATGGWYNSIGDIRIYDLVSGELKALLRGHSAVVLALAFSRDGRQLASGSSDGEAILWDARSLSDASTQEKRPVRRFSGHRNSVYGVAFSPDGARMVTGSIDGTLRLWSLSRGALLKEMTGHRDKVITLAVSPRDGTIASGDGSGDIRIWDGRSGAPLRVLDNQGGLVSSLNFSPDGGSLLATCAELGCGGKMRIYNLETRRLVAAYPKYTTAVGPGVFSPDGSLVATAAFDGDIEVWDPKTGNTIAALKGSGQPIRAVAFSANSRSIAWGHSLSENTSANHYGPLEMTFRLPGNGEPLSQAQPITSTGTWQGATARFGNLSLRNRAGGGFALNAILDILTEGQPSGASIERGPSDGYTHRSFSFTPDGKQVISGGANGTLTAYGVDGKMIGEFIGHESEVWALAPSPDGRYLVSGSNDQTVRLWNLRTRELLVTIFRSMDGDWVIWTPQGYYAGSPGADKIVGWQINKGPDKAADYVTAEQLRKHLNRPDIVAKAIQVASAEEAVRTSYGTGFKLSDLLARPAPHLRIVSPAADSTLQTPGDASVKIALDATPDPVTRIRIQVNGRQLDDFLPTDGPSFAAGEHSFPVPLAKGGNTIVVTALNEIGWSKVQDGTLAVTNESAGELDKRGTLYILAIGVSKYPNVANLCKPKPTCDLDFTGADATAFADAMSARLGPLHDKVVRRLLVNGGAADDAPTAANILDALGVLREAGPNDTVAVFLAGHGINDGPSYRFISTDAAMANGALKPSSVVPWYAIEEAIDGAKGRRLLFIDTCHSAGAYNQRLGNAAYYANILAYSSARWDQEAMESDDYKHGLFTYALVEGMSGAADLNHDGRVDTAELAEYLRKRVPQLAAKLKGEQEPQFFKGRDAETYPLAALP